MDKSWMYLSRRSSEPFMNGVQSFLNFAFERSSVDGRILCLCSHCLNMFYFKRGTVFDHLVCWGFKQDYSEWACHGEGSTASSSSTRQNVEDVDFHHDMWGLLNDIFQPIPQEENITTTEPTSVGEEEMDDSYLTILKIPKLVEVNLTIYSWV